MAVPEFIVHVTEMKGDNLNKLIKGHLQIEDYRIAFDGLVSSAQPGPNVNVSVDFPASMLSSLESLGLNTDEIEDLKAQAQQKIMDGEFVNDIIY
jgi:hypothetical protein